MKKALILFILIGALTSCTDSDNDGVIDRFDECPDEPGLEEFDGCPDTDGDGVPDGEDECPDEPGLKKFDGCPDTDEDGFQDSEDNCPDEPGLEEFNGCPDTDEDGIPDHEDDCPETYGYEKYDGCPDNKMMKLLASECFKSANMTVKEISEYTRTFKTNSNAVITYEHCQAIYDYIIKVREIQGSLSNLQSQINGGYIQTVYQSRFGQYLIVKKYGWFYLMQVLSGGRCSMGTMKFDERKSGSQNVWVRRSPNEGKYKGFQMRIIDKNKDFEYLNNKMKRMGY